MQHEVNALLLDILRAAESIQMFTYGIRFETYCDLDEKRWGGTRL
jgi:uncharacterized protein with HEPN domain